MRVPILAIDFDGVLHSYTSGWKGPRNIPDPPVDGAIPWLRSLLTDSDCVCAMAPRFKEFDVQIFSSRSRYWGGRAAMKRWLGREFKKAGYYYELVELLKFPILKPPSKILIDDRAFKFEGVFPVESELLEFKTWQGR